MRPARWSAAALLTAVVLGACTIEQDLTPRVDADPEGDAVAAGTEEEPDASPSPREPSPAASASPSPAPTPSPTDDPSEEPVVDEPDEPDPDPSPTRSPSPPPPSNRAPDANDDAVTAQEDGSVAVSVLANDDDPDGDVLAVQSVDQPSNGVARLSGDVVTYVPDRDFNGSDRLTYTVADPDGATDTAVVAITVRPVNDAPVATADGPYLVQAGQRLVISDLLDDDRDVDGDSLLVELVSGGTYGTVSSVDDTTVEYVHSGTYAGTSDRFRYRANDGTTFSDPVDVLLDVNFAPFANKDTMEVWSGFDDETFTFNVISGTVGSGCCSSGESWNGGKDSDPDGDPLTYLSPRSLRFRPTWMLGFQCAADGTCQIRVKACTDISDPYVFTYTIDDGRGGRASTTMSFYPKWSCLY